MKHTLLLAVIALSAAIPALAQRRRQSPVPAFTDSSNIKAMAFGAFALHQGPKPYKEVITDKAVTHEGLFTVHKVEDKWYFEIADSMMGREFMAITRFGKTGGGGTYGGELANQQTLEWEKGPSNVLFLRVVTLVSAADSTNKIYTAVRNSTVHPIAVAFDIKAYGKDFSSVVIDGPDFFKGDNSPIGIPQGIKGR